MTSLHIQHVAIFYKLGIEWIVNIRINSEDEFLAFLEELHDCYKSLDWIGPILLLFPPCMTFLSVVQTLTKYIIGLRTNWLVCSVLLAQIYYLIMCRIISKWQSPEGLTPPSLTAWEEESGPAIEHRIFPSSTSSRQQHWEHWDPTRIPSLWQRSKLEISNREGKLHLPCFPQ